MIWKGYRARVEYDAHDRLFVGHVADVRDIIGFHADSVEGLEDAFHEALDDYLAACERLGHSPDVPCSSPAEQ